MPQRPLSTLLSQVLVAFTIEFDNEAERRMKAQYNRPWFLTSISFWDNFLRFVGDDGITVGELAERARCPFDQVKSWVGGMERWGFVVVHPDGTTPRAQTKAAGFGSSRKVGAKTLLRLATGGRCARELWAGLSAEIEQRWVERFGDDAIVELKAPLRTIIDQIDVALPRYLPVVSYGDGMRAGFDEETHRGQPRDPVESLDLCALIAQTLLAFTLDFERGSALSLVVASNFLRPLDEHGIAVREYPLACGVAKEVTKVGMGALEKSGLATVGPAPDAPKKKIIRLTPAGVDAKAAYEERLAEVEKRWRERFGATAIDALRTPLEALLASYDGKEFRIVSGMHPTVANWRGRKQYVKQTEKVIADPSDGLPHHPVISHRGGWPDGA
jgi:hypothetical protein